MSRKCVTVPKNSKFSIFICRKCVTVPKNPKNPKIQATIITAQLSCDTCTATIFVLIFGFFGTVTHFLHMKTKNFEFFGTVTHFRELHSRFVWDLAYNMRGREDEICNAMVLVKRSVHGKTLYPTQLGTMFLDAGLSKARSIFDVSFLLKTKQKIRFSLRFHRFS